jgi:hypothetical protein
MFRAVKGGVTAVVILATMFLVVYWMAQNDTTDNTKNIEFIKSHSYNGKVVDMQNEISVRSVDDVKWYYDKGKTIVIEYGKVLLKYKTKEFITPEVQKDMNDIFIVVHQHPETFELKLLFQGEEMKEYVKR